ncbi:unnamed protein product, partial [Mesorhabditis spiculigera]
MYYFSKDFQSPYMMSQFCEARNREDLSFTIYVYFVTAIEFISLIITFLLYIPFIRILLHTAQFHENLRRIFLLIALIFQLNFICRTILVLYEFDVIRLTGWFRDDFPFMVACFLRYYLAITGMGCVAKILIERVCASKFIEDYEHTKRSYIFSVVLVINVTLGCTIATSIGFLVAIDEESLYRFLINFFLPFCGLLFICHGLAYFYLNTFNVKLLKELSAGVVGKRGYNLSMRFQVDENIKAIKLLNRVIIWMTFYGIATALVGTLHFAVLEEKNLWLGCFIEVWISGYVAFFLFICLWAVSEWRREFYAYFRNLFGTVQTGKVKPIIHDMVAESNEYFNYYKNEW